MSTFDVTSLRNRRADQRWNRTALGDILEYKLRERYGARTSLPK